MQLHSLHSLHATLFIQVLGDVCEKKKSSESQTAGEPSVWARLMTASGQNMRSKYGWITKASELGISAYLYIPK